MPVGSLTQQVLWNTFSMPETDHAVIQRLQERVVRGFPSTNCPRLMRPWLTVEVAFDAGSRAHRDKPGRSEGTVP